MMKKENGSTSKTNKELGHINTLIERRNIKMGWKEDKK